MDRGTLIVSVNRALWGEVGPALRRVAAKAQSGLISVRFYFDGEPSEEDRKSASCVTTEVIAEFPDYMIEEQIERCDAPVAMSYGEEWLTIYARREPLVSEL